MFLTFEGPDGAGKTTQIARLEARLLAGGYGVVRTREPGGGPVGEQVRALVLNHAVAPQTELLLFAAARAQNVADVIGPALANGSIVLCDRFVDSTVAYQGQGRGLPLALIAEINRFATDGLLPTRTFLLDLPVDEGLNRRRRDSETGGERNRLDDETRAFHERVRAGFHAVAQAEPGRVIIVDASADPDTVAEAIWQHVAPLLPKS